MPIERYVNELVHLNGMRENEQLHIPTVEDYFADTGRVLISEDPNQYVVNSPFNLIDGPPPLVIGTFRWSALWVDNIQAVDVTSFFTTPIVSGELSYRSWRMRALWRSGWMNAFYATNPDPDFNGTQFASLGDGSRSFNAVDGGWAIAAPEGNMISVIDGRYYWTGGPAGRPIDHWFPVVFQVELGYGLPGDNFLRKEGSFDWPAYSAGIGTDLLQHRGYSPSFKCFNGLANAPDVTGCPNTTGGYTPPPAPEDIP